MGSPVNPLAQAAAAGAVAAAEAAAALGAAQAEVAYQLTTQAVKGQPAVVIPLILLSLASIAEGPTAYTGVVTLADRMLPPA